MEMTAYAALVVSLIVSVAVNALQFYRFKETYRKLEELRNDREW